MRKSPENDELGGFLLEWSVELFGFFHDAYRTRFPQDTQRWAMANRHRRFWSAVASGREREAQELGVQVSAALVERGVGADEAEAIEGEILRLWLDVLIGADGAEPGRAGVRHLALLKMAARVGVRAAA